MNRKPTWSLLLLAVLGLFALGCDKTGKTPVLGPDGVPVDCPILGAGGLCYATMEDAARAIGADPKSCTVRETYPGKLSCAPGAP